MSETETSPRFINRNNDGEITGFRTGDFQYSTLGRLILYRLINNRDMKIIVTSSGSTTGTGKTTLAIHLCRTIRTWANEIFDANIQWNAKEYSFVNLEDYFEGYKEAPKGTALLPDEIEQAADRRRSMSHDNVNLSHAWSILRYRNVVSVATLPSTSMIDRRLMELADVWINVQYRGYGNTYYLTVDDFTHELIYKRLKQFGFSEVIRWGDLPDNDEDFQFLKDQKEELGIPGQDQGEDITKQDVNEAKRTTRDTVLENMLQSKVNGNLNLTQEEIANITNVSQQKVSKVKRTMKQNGEI